MIYTVRLAIEYDYATPADGGRHVVCVLPLMDIPGQKVVAGLLEIEPHPDERVDRHDFFGNQVTEFSIRAPHDRIAVTMQARIERDDTTALPSGACALADLPDLLSRLCDVGPASPLHFISPSFRVPLNAAMTKFARNVITPGMDTAEAVVAVGAALHRHMRFDAGATTVDTPASEAFSRRHGVCQDFSHIMIAALRGVGIPAGYVSGFLRTTPPPGHPRLDGADAMHAWVRAWCGSKAGWLEFDPTNDIISGPDHIVVAYGRDYSDVTPIKGVLRVSGAQAGQQAVDVIPVTEQ